jgi:hypothetical protein
MITMHLNPGRADFEALSKSSLEKAALAADIRKEADMEQGQELMIICQQLS